MSIQKHFAFKNIHFAGNSEFGINCLGVLYTVGPDDLVYRQQINQNKEQRYDLTPYQHNTYALAVHPYEKDTLVIGGENKKIEVVRQDKFEEAETIYECMGVVYHCVFSNSGQYIGLATQQQNAILYNYKTRSVAKCRPGHKDSVISVVFSPDEKIICSSGLDGYFKIYKIDDKLEPQLQFQTQISDPIDSLNSSQKLKCSINGNKKYVIALSGRKKLQVLEYIDKKYIGSVNDLIYHEKQIHLTYWHSNQILITSGLENKLKIWNYKASTQLLCFEVNLTSIIKYDDIFLGINYSGSIYKFETPEALQIPEIKNQMPANQKPQTIQVSAVEQSYQETDQQQITPEIIKKNTSKANQLIIALPQLALTRSTEYFRNQRFLHYNTIGCVIERIEGESKIVSIEYFSKLHESKNRDLFTDKVIKHIDFNFDNILYAGLHEFGFIKDKITWQMPYNNICNLCLGSEWMAIANEELISIFDLAGNQISNIPMDKNIVAIRAYENLLACVFHDSPSMYGSQMIRVKLYSADQNNSKSVYEGMVPLTPRSELKSFGFSRQGLIYSEDSLGKIRVWMLQSDEWILIRAPDQQVQNERYWLIGMEQYRFVNFILPEQEEFPTVVPKPAIKTVQVSVPILNNSQHKNKEKEYGRLLWARYILNHQRYRHNQWYKYKLARSSQNPNYQISASIMNSGEIKTKENNLELEYIYLIKHYLTINEAQRAYQTVKTFVKTQKTAAKISQIFEAAGLRGFSIKIEIYFEEKAKLKQYSKLKEQRFQQHKIMIESKIKQSKLYEKPLETRYEESQPKIIPFVQKSQRIEQLIRRAQINDIPNSNSQIVNPFAKKDSVDPIQKYKRQLEARIENAHTNNSKKSTKAVKIPPK